MKFIQSCWSCGNKNLLTHCAGWLAPEYNLMAWALSCLQLKRYYNDISLYADKSSAKILIDELKLPYSEVENSFSNLNHYHPQLWALPKIDTYSKQNAPFLHVDGDVFVWEPFDDYLLEAGLIAQNKEIGGDYYENILQSFERELTYFPFEIIADREAGNTIFAYNAGIFGGNDVDFFKLYSQKAKEFIDNNVNCLSSINIGNFNVFFEQYLFNCLVNTENKKVSVLIPDVIGADNYIGFGDFIDVPHDKKYLHVLGPYKRNKTVCEQLASRLRQDYPEYYYRIISLFKGKQIPLERDYYYFIEQPMEQYLTERYFQIKQVESNSLTNESVVSSKKNEIAPHKIGLIEKINLVIDNQQLPTEDREIFVRQINDVKLFETNLTSIINVGFRKYSKNFLYRRDIDNTGYFQYIFEDKDKIGNKIIVIDPIVELIESEYNWSYMEESNILEQLNAVPSNQYTAVIPECDFKGYSLVNIVDLDAWLLQATQIPVTINDVLNELKPAFDSKDIESNYKAFKTLILGRIKQALYSKLIKPII